MGLCLACVTQPAWSQASSGSAQTASFEASHVAAAREALSAMMVDNGSASMATLESFRLIVPMFRQQITASPFYVSLTPQRQAAIDTYMSERMPDIAHGEAMRGVPELLTRFAPRMAALFSEAELADVIAYMRSPESASFIRREMLRGVNAALGNDSEATPPTAEEAAAYDRFLQTPGGAAFAARLHQLQPVLREFGYATTSAPPIAARLRRDMCAIAEDQCPPAWRNS